MNKSLMAGTMSVLLFAVPAAAAGPQTVFNWTGFYTGAHAAYGWGDYHVADDVPSVYYRIKPRGLLGGVQAGYNLQLGQFVVGVEADASLGGVSAKKAPDYALIDSVGFETDWLASVRGRAGVTFSNLLIYGTVGYGTVRWQDKQEVSGEPWGAQPKRKRDGLVFGFGTEYAASPNWSFKIEYLRYDFGRWITTEDLFWGIGANHLDLKIDTVKLGVNYRFGSGGVR